MALKKIFVTGSTGFIGANLIPALVKEGYSVSALLRKNSNHPFLKNLSFNPVWGDIFDNPLLDTTISNTDIIIHCAAIVSFKESDKREIYHTNVTGTENILKYALKHKKKVIFVSTASTIGAPTNSPIIIDEEYPFVFKNISSYSHSKYLAEQRVLYYCGKGLDALIVNPSTVYGAGDCKGTGPALYKLISSTPIFFAPPGGSSVIAVQDVVSGIIAALERGQSGQKYILTAENVSYKTLFTTILRLAYKRNSTLITIPSFVEPFGVFLLKKLPLDSKTITPTIFRYLFQYRYLNNEKAKNDLHWLPKVSIEQALEEGYTFYIQNTKSTYGT